MPILSFLLFLLAFFGVQGDWLTFPLTAPLRGSQMIWIFDNGQILPIGPIFLILLGGGVILLLLRQFVSSTVLLCAALTILLLQPWYGGFIQLNWLAEYIAQSQEKEELYYFTQSYFIPNLNPEPTFRPIKQFEFFIDQANIAFAMLGSGWYLVFLGNLGLLGILFYCWRFPLKLLVALLLIISLWTMPVQRTASRLLQADSAQQRGNQLLVNGQAQFALQQYAKALAHNQALSFSAPFLIKASEAYAVMSEGHHPLGKVAEAWRLIQQKALFKLHVKKYTFYHEAQSLLNELTIWHQPSTNLEQSLYELGQHLSVRLWRYEGLTAFAQNNLNHALQAFQQAASKDDNPATQFYLASTYMKLGKAQFALSILPFLAGQIAHPDVAADIYCTIGDAYTQEKNFEAARKAYTTCQKLDNIKNYRALKALSGS